MLSRTTSRTVTFRMPFTLAAVEHELPAGAYVVETDEELIQGLSFPAYRRVAAFLQIPSRRVSGGRRSIPVDPEELEAALARDFAGEDEQNEQDDQRTPADDGRRNP